MKDKDYCDLFEFLSLLMNSGADIHIMDDTVLKHILNDDCPDDDDDLPFGDDTVEGDFCDSDALDCDSCELACEFSSDDWYWGIPEIRRIVFNDPATIVFWDDGTKTIVKCIKGDKFEPYAGFAAACMKKMFGSTAHAKSVMDTLAVNQKAKTLPEDDDESLG